MTLPFTLEIAANIEDEEWNNAFPDLEDLYVRATNRAIENIVENNNILFEGSGAAIVEISLVFATDNTVQGLNDDYRNQDKPTNVLSFPDSQINTAALEESALHNEAVIFGDIILARETVFAEAKAQRKSIADHLSHLLVHGILHLAGYDHIEDDEAEIMESFEIKILSQLGISNPYEETPPATAGKGTSSNE